MRPAITFLNPQNFKFFYKDFVISIEVIYPDRDNLSRFGDILSLRKAWKTVYFQYSKFQKGHNSYKN